MSEPLGKKFLKKGSGLGKVYFISHVEGIKARNIKNIVNEISGILEWNRRVISSFDNAEFILLVNKESREHIKINELNIIDISDLNEESSKDLNNLNKEIQNIDWSKELNFGVDFEQKCFERFVYALKISEILESDKIFHLDADLAISHDIVRDILEYNKEQPYRENLVISPSKYGSYFAGFNNKSLHSFVDFLLNGYFSEKKITSYRICDMGALLEMIERKNLYFDDSIYDKYSYYVKKLEQRACGFHYAVDKITKELGTPLENVWKQPENKIIENIRNHENFFVLQPDMNISLEGKSVPFIHFHGWLKRLAPLFFK